MDFCEHLGNRLRRMRERKGYMVWEIAKACCVAEYVISSVEDGDNLPNYALFCDWCRTLGVTTGAVMSAYKWTYTEPHNNDFSQEVA